MVNDSSHKLYQFHQRDLDEKRVLFVHKGVSFGRFVLFITDGKHYTSTLLEVSAQDPYLKVANNTGLLVQKGKEVILRPANLSVTTNVDVRGLRKPEMTDQLNQHKQTSTSVDRHGIHTGLCCFFQWCRCQMNSQDSLHGSI